MAPAREEEATDFFEETPPQKLPHPYPYADAIDASMRGRGLSDS